MPLPLRKQVFVAEYLVDLAPGPAAIRAGYSARGANQAAHRLLQEPAVQDALAEAMAARSRRTHISADRVLRELARIAFSDIRDSMVWDEAGGIRLLDSIDIGDDAAAAIQEVSETRTGAQVTRKVKLASKHAALVALMPHLGLKTQAAEDISATEQARKLLETLRAMEATVGAGAPVEN